MIEIKLLADCQEHMPYLAKLWYEEISRHWVPDASIDKAMANLIKHANRDKLPMTFVALINGQPVGMASLRDNDGIKPGLSPWLGSLIVDPQYRNKKIGEQLIEAVKKQAFSLAYPSLYLLAFDPIIPNWYSKLGWKLIGEDQLFGHSVVVMEFISNIINQYGDIFNPIGDGHGVDVASQRQDALDLSSLEFIRQQLSLHQKVHAVDLGGGLGSHSIQMAKLGASVTLIDIADIPTTHFPSNLSFIQKDFTVLKDEDIQNNIDVLYSQRAIHYLPYSEAKKLLKWMHSRMKKGGAIFISAAGLKAEYGSTYPDKNKPIENRFNYIATDMQQKFNVYQKLVLYSEEEMNTLLTDVGFIDIHVTSSDFGSVKAIARNGL